MALPPRPRPPLTIPQILRLADEWHAKTGEWPTSSSGPIPNTDEKWRNIHFCLVHGYRGLSGGTTLVKLLEERRGFRFYRNMPPLTESQILKWADEHHKRTGEWPTVESGDIVGTRDEKWASVDHSLKKGRRGLTKGSGLLRLLHAHRGARDRSDLPPLTEEQILSWMDSYRERTGEWPRFNSGVVKESPDESWSMLNVWLRVGGRGLPGGSSLKLLLAERRGLHHRLRQPELSESIILAWADAHHRETGKWPLRSSGDIPGTEDDWFAVERALQRGSRGLPGGSSLARLLEKCRGVRNRLNSSRLTEKKILKWAKAYRKRHGNWPLLNSGEIPELADGTNWNAVNAALTHGCRGLPGGTSLAKLVGKR